MNTGKMLYSRPDGTRIEMVYVENGECMVKVMEWPEALQFFITGLQHVAEIADLPGLARYIEARKAE